MNGFEEAPLPDELEALLAELPGTAPDHFTDRVMAAVALAPRVAVRRPQGVIDAMPWWTRAALQPPAIAAALLAGLLAWRPAGFETAGRSALAGTAALCEAIGGWFGVWLGPAAASPALQLGAAACIALLSLIAAGPIFRWTERVASRSAV